MAGRVGVGAAMAAHAVLGAALAVFPLQLVLSGQNREREREVHVCHAWRCTEAEAREKSLTWRGSVLTEDNEEEKPFKVIFFTHISD